MKTHKINYAYPSSENAKRVNRGKTGAWCLEIEKDIFGYDSYSEACRAAEKAGTYPDRWSLDHPMNEKFLRPEQREVTTQGNWK